MKITKIFAHPLLQLISFSILLVGSAYFGGPFLFFLYHAAQEGYVYGIIGALGILVTIVAIFYNKPFVQGAGLLLMILSLLIFFISGKLANAYTFHQIIPFITLALFISVVIAVCVKFFDLYKR